MDDEIFDDLHVGVVALREVAKRHNLELSPKAVETLTRLERTVPTLRESLANLRRRLRDDAYRIFQKTDESVRQYPWVFALTALGLGFLAGFLFFKKEEEERS